MRLIDADALLKFPIRLTKYDKKNGNKHFVFGIESVLEYAENLPTIDAVEVVRCKDCKHMKYAIVKDKNGMCGVHSALIVMNGNDYCSYGERKNDD